MKALQYYTETHHIIPEYRGGGDEPENLINVPIREHALWHWCEWKRTGDSKDLSSYHFIMGKIRWLEKGCPIKKPPFPLKPGSREWKIARLYRRFGGKMWWALRDESVTNLYKRMFNTKT